MRIIIFLIASLVGFSAIAETLPDRTVQVAQATVSSPAPQTRDDGSALPADQIAGYEIFVAPGRLTDDIQSLDGTIHYLEGSLLQGVVPLNSGFNVLAASTVDTNGSTSEWSNLVEIESPAESRPNPPPGLEVSGISVINITVNMGN
jgi:hypothetical protein